MSIRNRLVRFVKKPEGRPTPDVFELDEEIIPDIAEGQFLVRNLYLSMDPALVGRMRDEDNYVEGVKPGQVMQAYAVGQVVESRHPKVKVGELRFGQLNMQEYALCEDESAYRKIFSTLAKPSWYLSVVGITGVTAYFGLLDLGVPKRGETVLISAGASSVGSIAAQIAKLKGCRVVAIVSTEEKALHAKQRWGYDDAVSYRGKSIGDLSADIGRACPKGVDIYFDNTSGDISEAVLDHYNDYARVLVIGRLAISHLSDTRLDAGRRDNSIILAKRIKKCGMVVLDYQSKTMGAVLQLCKWMRQGSICIDEDIVEGIDRAPEAFFRMLDGESQGKQLVKLGEVDQALDKSPKGLSLLVSDIFPTTTVARLITGGIV